jgi:hypothetical protein
MDDHKKDSKNSSIYQLRLLVTGSHTSISGVAVVKGAEESFPTIAICTRTLKDPK